MSFLHDHKGKQSLTRLLTAIVVLTLIFWPLVLWTVVSIWGDKSVMKLAELPASVVEFVKWSLGTIIVYAGHNKLQEARAPVAPVAPPAS